MGSPYSGCTGFFVLFKYLVKIIHTILKNKVNCIDKYKHARYHNLNQIKGLKIRMKNRIKELRKPLGLSQHRLGKKSGVTRVTINRIETENTVPTLKVAIDIANALGVCLYKVFDLDGKETYRCQCCNCVESQ